MSQKFPVNNFEWIEDTSRSNDDNGESDEGYFLEVDVQYLENLHELCNDLPCSPKNMKIEKVEKLVSNLYDKIEYVIHIRNVKQALNHALVLKNVHRVIKFNQNAWLEPYIDMNTDLTKKAKNDFEKFFFKLINNVVFRKIMENVIKRWNITLVTTESRRIYWVSEPNYHNTKFFLENLLTIEMKKTQILLNKPAHLGLSLQELGMIFTMNM